MRSVNDEHHPAAVAVPAGGLLQRGVAERHGARSRHRHLVVDHPAPAGDMELPVPADPVHRVCRRVDRGSRELDVQPGRRHDHWACTNRSARSTSRRTRRSAPPTDARPMQAPARPPSRDGSRSCATRHRARPPARRSCSVPVRRVSTTCWSTRRPAMTATARCHTRRCISATAARGNEIDWSTQGAANEIIDNLIRTGKLQPVVVVATDFNGLPTVDGSAEEGYARDLIDNVDPVRRVALPRVARARRPCLRRAVGRRRPGGSESCSTIR